MNKLKQVLLVIVLGILFWPVETFASNNEVNVYLFYGQGCPHCKALEEALEEMKIEYPNLRVNSYEIWGSAKNRKAMKDAASLLGEKAPNGVPFTIIGTKHFLGYSEYTTKGEIEYVIEMYSSVDSYKDPVGKMLGVVKKDGSLTYDDIISGKNVDSSKDENVINVPLVGPVELKHLSLPVLSIVIGAIDGFNPCAMWVLLFLISVLLGMKDRKRMWILGVSFLVTSALVYLAFMVAWLNLALFIGAIWWVKLLIALAALAGGYFNLRAFLKSKEKGCHVVDQSKRNKIFTKIKAFTNEQSFPIALLGIITLAISVNFIELTCSAGLPVIFTNILALNNLSTLEYSFYIFLYILFFLIDDLIIFIIAMISLKMTGVSAKYGKYSHLIGGIIMIIIGLLMIYKPEWLMFNF